LLAFFNLCQYLSPTLGTFPAYARRTGEEDFHRSALPVESLKRVIEHGLANLKLVIA